MVQHTRLGAARADSESDEDESEQESKAKQVNTYQKDRYFSDSLLHVYFIHKNMHTILKAKYLPVASMLMQEYEKFARFTDSLLSRSSKLTELISSLEAAFAETEKSDTSAEGIRVKKL